MVASQCVWGHRMLLQIESCGWVQTHFLSCLPSSNYQNWKMMKILISFPYFFLFLYSFEHFIGRNCQSVHYFIWLFGLESYSAECAHVSICQWSVSVHSAASGSTRAERSARSSRSVKILTAEDWVILDTQIKWRVDFRRKPPWVLQIRKYPLTNRRGIQDILWTIRYVNSLSYRHHIMGDR